MKIEVGKKYKTGNDYIVSITKIDDSGEYPVNGISSKNGYDYSNNWTIKGKYYSSGEESIYDLIEAIPEDQYLKKATEIDISKKYKTLIGREVRLYADDGSDNSPIHGSIKYNNGWEIASWSRTGKRLGFKDNYDDLVETKERIKRVVWINVYEELITIFTQKEDADNHSVPSRLACVKVEIDCEIGEGL